ncbi:MAG: hypothetical protein IJ587_00080 [Synergistaceae bacterium]|nr:hypothetical protein [Synergistaceae bacterium]
MSRAQLWCDICARRRGQNESGKPYCDAYPEGVPESVFYSGHLYPKEGDNGLRFKAISGVKVPKYLQQTQEEEDTSYREMTEKSEPECIEIDGGTQYA